MKNKKINFAAGFKGKKYDHLWGYELWIENNEIYCSKLLVLNHGFESSWLYHERKDETFIVLEGQVALSYARDINAAVQETILEVGDKFRLKPGVVHSLKSLSKSSIVMEVSTTDDNDNVKIRPARRL